MDMEIREGDINNVIKELIEFVRYELQALGIECVLKLAPDLPLLEYDERYIKQALLNLIKIRQWRP